MGDVSWSTKAFIHPKLAMFPKGYFSRIQRVHSSSIVRLIWHLNIYIMRLFQEWLILALYILQAFDFLTGTTKSCDISRRNVHFQKAGCDDNTGEIKFSPGKFCWTMRHRWGLHSVSHTVLLGVLTEQNNRITNQLSFWSKIQHKTLPSSTSVLL